MGSDPETLETANLALPAVIAWIESRLATGVNQVRLHALDPDPSAGHYDGEPIGSQNLRHRSFRVWLDLAQRLRMRLAMPRAVADGRIELTLTRLDDNAQWKRNAFGDVTEKYGTASPYQRISKLEDPDFVLDLSDALVRIGLPPQPRVLELGVNTGDTLALLRARLPRAPARRFVGIDHCGTAIAAARARFPEARLEVCDLSELPRLKLPRFDLILAIATLHSPGVDDRALLRLLVQQHLDPRGGIIVGVPNCSYVDGEVLDGATTRNFTQPELSLLIKSVASYRKYLQQHRCRVFVTGKRTVLVTGVSRRDVHGPRSGRFSRVGAGI